MATRYFNFMEQEISFLQKEILTLLPKIANIWNDSDKLQNVFDLNWVEIYTSCLKVENTILKKPTNREVRSLQENRYI